MRSRTVTSAAIAALILVALVALFIKARGFRASSTPGAFETSAARLVRDFAIPRAAKGRKNPFAGDEQAVGQGRDEFLSRCATCHGSDGRGATPIGANLYPRVPDLRGPTTQAPDRRRNPLHHREWHSAHRHARNAGAERAGRASQLGAGDLPPQPALSDAR